MKIKDIDKKQRLFAGLMTAGAGVLLFRTIRMIFIEHAFDILQTWVIVLLVIEFLVDVTCIISSIRWFILNHRKHSSVPLKLGAMATIFHFIRVMIYALSRTTLFNNFDIKPAIRASYTYSLFWVYFATILSILGMIGLIIIWRIIRSYQSKAE